MSFVIKVSGEEKTTPAEFHAFEDKKFAFKIKVGRFNIDKHLDGYGIRKLTNESSIVASLEERFSDIQVSFLFLYSFIRCFYKYLLLFYFNMFHIHIVLFFRWINLDLKTWM